MTPTTEQMLDGLFATHRSLVIQGAPTVMVSTDFGAVPLGTGDDLASAVRAAWTAERDRLHKALAALGAPVPVDSPSEAPAGPETAQERPEAWAPMDTCPRGRDGRLTEDVWVRWGSAGVDCVEAGRGLPEVHDVVYDRHGWLPGYLNRSDLPPVEVTP